MASRSKKENIQVFVRVRPLSSSEKRQKSPAIVDASSKTEVCVKDSLGNANKSFTFDRVFGPSSKQIEVYKEVLHQIIDEVLAGYNCTVFAYGQTGSGKTFTMEGERSADENLSWEDDPLCGIIPRCFSQLFNELHVAQMDHTVRVSFLEIYNEELIDLLSLPGDNTKLKLYDDAAKKGSVIVSGLEERTVKSKNEIYKILEKGAAKRQTASTLMNAQSSRSHTIFSITVHVKEIAGEEELFRTGKLNLVDLAGSENIGRSGAVDKRAREAGNINQSLLTLGRVITALVEHRPHVPYRESKLTRMLQDSLGGRTKTSIIATVSPAALNFDETLSTLNYASRAKNIVNKPEINQKQSPKDLLKEYIEELDRLRRDLKANKNKEGIFIAEENYNEMMLKLKNHDEEVTDQINRIRNLEEIIQELELKTKEHEAKIEQCEEELAEKDFILEEMSKTEKRLLTEAKEVQNVAGLAANHVSLLHDKISRKDVLEEQNRSAISKLCDQLIQDLGNVEEMYENFVDSQISLQTKLKEGMDKVSHNSERFADDVTQGSGYILDKLNATNLHFLEELVLKSKNDMVKLCDEITDAVKNDIVTRKLEFDEFFESVISYRVSCLSSIIESLEKLHKKAASMLNENLTVMESLYKNNDLICCNLEKGYSDNLQHLNELLNDCNEIFKSSEQILEEYMAGKQVSLEALKSNKLILNEIDQNINGNLSSLEEQSTKLNDMLNKHVNDVKNFCSDDASQYAALKEEGISAYNVLSDMTSIEALIQDYQNDMRETVSSMELYKKPAFNESDNCYSELVERSSRDFSSKITDISERIRNTSQTLIENIGVKIQTCLEKSAAVSSDLQTKSIQISNELSKFIDHDSILSNEEFRTYIPTGNTPQRKEYKLPELQDVDDSILSQQHLTPFSKSGGSTNYLREKNVNKSSGTSAKGLRFVPSIEISQAVRSSTPLIGNPSSSFSGTSNCLQENNVNKCTDTSLQGHRFGFKRETSKTRLTAYGKENESNQGSVGK